MSTPEQTPVIDLLHTKLRRAGSDIEEAKENLLKVIDDLSSKRAYIAKLDAHERSLRQAIDLITPRDCASNEPASAPESAHANSYIAAALKTLKALGYEHTGGVEWRPPHGEKPVFEDEQVELLKLLDEMNERYAQTAGFNRIRAYVQQGGKFAGDIPNAMNAIKAAMAKDLGYAWAWHCNIAGPVADALERAGVKIDRRAANLAAAALMRHMFDVDMERDGHYRDTQKPTATEQAMPAADPFEDKMVRFKREHGDSGLMRYIGRTAGDLAQVETAAGLVTHCRPDLLEVVPPSEGGYPEETPEEVRELEAIAAKPLRPVIAYPARRIGLTLTHATIGDALFTGAVRLALLEFADHQYEAETTLEPLSKPAYPFTASNGVSIDVEPWLTIDAEDERPGQPIPRAGEAAIAAAAEAAKDLKGFDLGTDDRTGVAPAKLVQNVTEWLLRTTKSPTTQEAWLPLHDHPGYSLHIARRESDEAIMMAQGVANLLRNPVPVGMSTMFLANGCTWAATVEPMGKNMQDQATTAEEDEAFAELASKRGAGEVAAKEPIRVNLTYDWAQFVHYGQENTAGPIAHGLPWSFRFHGHPVTHENDTCYIVGGNSGSDSLYFHKGDIITVDAETNDISIKSPATPDALAPEVPEQPIALDMDAVAKAALVKEAFETISQRHAFVAPNSLGGKVIETKAVDAASADDQGEAKSNGATIHQRATELLVASAKEIDARKQRQNRIDAGHLIPPAIGRRVWFHPFQPSPNVKVQSVEQALDAGVVYVWSDNMVNLDVTDHAGNHHAFTSVRLVQPEDATIPVGQNWAEWMPFQVKQAQGSK